MDMKRITGLLVTGVLFSMMLGGSADAATPLRVKVATPDGNPKVKVAKKVKLLASCSKDCNITAKLKLISPANTLTGNVSRGLRAQQFWTIGFVLTRYGRNYLKDNYRDSKLKVRLSAVDLETGKRTVKIRTFRFRL